jgi:hypothetical protein
VLFAHVGHDQNTMERLLFLSHIIHIHTALSRFVYIETIICSVARVIIRLALIFVGDYTYTDHFAVRFTSNYFIIIMHGHSTHYGSLHRSQLLAPVKDKYLILLERARPLAIIFLLFFAQTKKAFKY